MSKHNLLSSFVPLVATVLQLVIWTLLFCYEADHSHRNVMHVLGDHSRCSQPPVDTKTMVAFLYMGLILNRNFHSDVNWRLGTT